MVYRTFGDLRQQAEAELDIQGEEFCTASEIQSYFNSAIILCEATVIKLGLREKYLQGEAYISTVAGQADYDLPADITLTKIRKLVYRNSTLVYTLKPLRGEGSYETEDVLNASGSSGDESYHYSLYKSGTTYKIRLTPKASLSVANAVRVIYFKTLNRYTAEATVCDLPDICYEYLLSYVRYRVYAKERHVNTDDEKQNMQALMVLMQETMQNQVADPEMDMMDQDYSHYEEMN